MSSPSQWPEARFELERLLGLGRGTVVSHISKVRQGRLKKQKYFKIEINDEEELE